MLQKNRSNKSQQWKFAFILPLLIAFIFAFNTELIAQETENIEIRKVEKNIKAYIITKTTKDLEKLKATLAKKGVDAKFKNVKHNSEGEITGIKIDLKSESSNANFSISSGEPINPIKITFEDNGGKLSIVNTPSTNTFFFDAKGIHTSKNAEGHETIKIVKTVSTHHAILIDENEEKPLIIINGKESSQNIEDISPESIENITVLKGASANKKYGDRGNNGVIIINKTIEVTGYEDSNNKTIRIRSNEGEEPLIIIDGKISSKKAEDIAPNNIQSMSVLKGETAQDKYGDKGKDGVIEIITKKK